RFFQALLLRPLSYARPMQNPRRVFHFAAVWRQAMAAPSLLFFVCSALLLFLFWCGVSRSSSPSVCHRAFVAPVTWMAVYFARLQVQVAVLPVLFFSRQLVFPVFVLLPRFLFGCVAIVLTCRVFANQRP